MKSLFGFPLKLTLDLNGEPFDVTSCVQIEGTTTGRGIFIDEDKLVRAVNAGRKVRRTTPQSGRIYWQQCPVCHGKGIVPGGFYLSPMTSGVATDTAPERCRRCQGEGTISVPTVTFS